MAVLGFRQNATPPSPPLSRPPEWRNLRGAPIDHELCAWLCFPCLLGELIGFHNISTDPVDAGRETRPLRPRPV